MQKPTIDDLYDSMLPEIRSTTRELLMLMPLGDYRTEDVAKFVLLISAHFISTAAGVIAARDLMNIAADGVYFAAVDKALAEVRQVLVADRAAEILDEREVAGHG